ncbi:hypothetical protein [Paenibacillus macerans]|uniref:hypothetical protein n=1 Tax=Paenibacillus macerans TaxID=44252 RepID=UPI003D319F36
MLYAFLVGIGFSLAPFPAIHPLMDLAWRILQFFGLFTAIAAGFSLLAVCYKQLMGANVGNIKALTGLIIGLAIIFGILWMQNG